MTKTLLSTFAWSLLALGKAASAQALAPSVSPQVHADNRVTFRFQAPNAKDVQLELEGADPVRMQKGIMARTEFANHHANAF
jgi:hypothetical protein